MTIFEGLEGGGSQSRILYPAKIPFKKPGIKTSSDKQNLRDHCHKRGSSGKQKVWEQGKEQGARTLPHWAMLTAAHCGNSCLEFQRQTEHRQRWPWISQSSQRAPCTLSSYVHIFPAIHGVVVTCVKGSVLHVFGLFHNRELKQKKWFWSYKFRSEKAGLGDKALALKHLPCGEKWRKRQTKAGLRFLCNLMWRKSAIHYWERGLSKYTEVSGLKSTGRSMNIAFYTWA